MRRNQALEQVDSIINTRLEMHGVHLDERGREAMQAIGVDLRNMLTQVFNDHDTAYPWDSESVPPDAS